MKPKKKRKTSPPRPQLVCVFRKIDLEIVVRGKERVYLSEEVCGTWAPRNPHQTDYPLYPTLFLEPLCRAHAAYADDPRICYEPSELDDSPDDTSPGPREALPGAPPTFEVTAVREKLIYLRDNLPAPPPARPHIQQRRKAQRG